MDELRIEDIDAVCNVCHCPAVQVAGQWLHVEYADAMFCAVLRGAIEIIPADEP